MALRGRKKGCSPSTERPVAVTSKSRGARPRYKRTTKGRRRNSRKLRHDKSSEVKPSGSGVKTSDMSSRAKGHHKIEIRKRSAHRTLIRRIRAATRLPSNSTTIASTTPHSKSLHGYNLRSSTSLHKRSTNDIKVSVGRPARSSPVLKTKSTGKKRHRPRSAPPMRSPVREGEGRIGPRNVQRRGLHAYIMKGLMTRLIIVHCPDTSHRVQKNKPTIAKLRRRGVINNQSESIVTAARKLKRRLAETAPIVCVMCLRNGKMKCSEFTNYWPAGETSSALF